MVEVIRTIKILPPKSANFFGETANENFLYNVKTSRCIIDTPEYFYQQPTPIQEEKFKEDYDILWKRLAKEDGVHVPQTINTYFGKTQFIEDELRFRDFRKIKYAAASWGQRKDYHLQFEELRKARKEAYEKLNSLSKKEVADLRNKSTGTPLQIADPHTGRLLTFPSYE